jgi:hypothetical protein
VRVRLTLQRQRRQPQPHRPSFRACLEQRRILLGQPRLEVVLGQQLGHLGDGEDELCRTHLAQLSADQQPVQRQGRVEPGRQHQPQLLRGMAQQELEAREHRRVGDVLDVVEDQHHRGGQLGKAADQQ